MLSLKIDSRAHLTGHLPGAVADRIKARLTFPNPAHQEAEKRWYWTGDIPHHITGYQLEGDVLIIPRGFSRQLIGVLRGAGAPEPRLN